MKYKCRANIEYEVVADADSTDEARIAVFDCLADDVAIGLIRTEHFEYEDSATYGCAGHPTLKSVDVLEELPPAPIYHIKTAFGKVGVALKRLLRSKAEGEQ